MSKEIHNAAKAMPEMNGQDYDSLRDDIKAHGLLTPIELCEGKIIDGRHRYRVCKELDIKPEFVDAPINGQTPAEYVWSLNGARRHLTASQRAAVAAELMDSLRERHPPGKPKQAKMPALQNRDRAAKIVGVGSRYVSDAETIKKESPDIFDQVKSGEKTLSQAKRMAEESKTRKSAVLKISKIEVQSDTNVLWGDSFKLAESIPDGSCSLVFTDPPYDRKSLGLYDELQELAERILCDGGSLITYLGQHLMPDVIEKLNKGRLRWFWPLCCQHTGNTAQMREYGIKVKWKPMLWFVKGGFRFSRNIWIDDLVVSEKEKCSHPWQQSVIEASYYIDKLTSEGELVVDPFCGGGTTAVACKKLKRQWWTCDIDENHVTTARDRLNDTYV